MQKKYSYSEKYNEKLEQYLRHHGIRYRIVGDGCLVPKLVCFAVYDEASRLREFQNTVHSKPIITNEFTQRELNAAKYLTMTARNNSVTILNEEDAFSYKCPRKNIFGNQRFEHKVQVGLFRIKRFNTYGKTVFFSSSTGFFDLFAREDACEMMQRSNVAGLQTNPVYWKENKRGDVCNLRQLYSEKIIPDERVFVDNLQKVRRCPVCGARKILCGQDYQLQLIGSELDLSDDFYMTEAIFGSGISYPLYIVSQRLYQLLVGAGMTHNVAFEPVIFRDADTIENREDGRSQPTA